MTVGRTWVAEALKRDAYRLPDILRRLLEIIKSFGKPKAIRTVNEPIFTSKLFALPCGRSGFVTSGQRPMRLGRTAESKGLSAR